MKRLGTTILQRILIIICFSFSASAIFTYYYFEKILVGQMLFEDQTELEQLVKRLEYLSDEIANFAFTLVISDAIQTFYTTYADLDIYDQFALFQKTIDFLDSYEGLRREVTSYALVLKDGTAFWSEAGYDPYFGEKMKEPWYVNFIESGVPYAFTEPHQLLITANSIVESDMISFIAPVKNIKQPHEQIGHFIVNLSIEPFHSLLHYENANFDGLVWMNASDRILYQYEMSDQTIKALRELRDREPDFPERAILETKGGYFLVDGIEKYGWKIVTFVPMKSLMERSKFIIYLLLFFSIVNSVVILLMMMPAIFRITRPIMRLYHAMNSVSKGDLHTSVSIKTGDELERLGDGFNRMVTQLRQHLEESIKHEKEKRELELDLLLSQLNPHFVYNTLNAVIYLARSKGHTDIVKMVSAFIRLLQDSTKTGEENRLIPVQYEIALLKDYIEIQSYRYAGMFEIEWSIDQHALDYLVPRYLLQPFVENAIFHGICAKDEPTGKIRIVVGIDNDNLLIQIEDDGVGIDPAVLPHLWEMKKKSRSSGLRHIGLANTRRRLEHLFGHRAQLKIDSMPGQGTTVTIQLPPLLSTP